MYPILMKHQIIGYFRYGDDILFIYNQRKTNMDEMLTEFNKQQPTIQFTIGKESLTFSVFEYTAGKKRWNLQYIEDPLKQVS
jgi:hypothetical protein